MHTYVKHAYMTIFEGYEFEISQLPICAPNHKTTSYLAHAYEKFNKRPIEFYKIKYFYKIRYAMIHVISMSFCS